MKHWLTLLLRCLLTVLVCAASASARGAGQVTHTFDHDAVGNVIARTGTPPNLYLFTGQQFDPDLGLYYLRARYHNPDSGRFWSADAFEGFASDPASLHRYTFNQNDPGNRIDPSGNVSLGEQLTVTGLAPVVSKALYASLAYVFSPDFSEHVFSLETVLSMTSSDKAAMVGLGAIYLGSQLMGPGAYERFGAMATGVGALRKGSATYPQLISAYQRAYSAVAKTPSGTLALVPKGIRSLGQWGEARLAQVLGEAGVKPAKPFSTSLGRRFVDRLVNGIAHESKAGLNVGLNSSIELQILKDAELIQSGRIQGAHWHFFQGAQSNVLEFLTKHGIP